LRAKSTLPRGHLSPPFPLTDTFSAFFSPPSSPPSVLQLRGDFGSTSSKYYFSTFPLLFFFTLAARPVLVRNGQRHSNRSISPQDLTASPPNSFPPLLFFFCFSRFLFFRPPWATSMDFLWPPFLVSVDKTRPIVEGFFSEVELLVFPPSSLLTCFFYYAVRALPA